jgi:phosphoglycerate dehydrogenase-like enzyme
MTKIAVLDDYQGVALGMADWSRLPKDADVQVFREHILGEDARAERLQPFEVICCMRERTPFPRTLLQRLPKLKLLVTAGARNASFDMAAAKELGVTVCGTGGLPGPGPARNSTTAELTWGLILAVTRSIAFEDQAVRAGKWQTTIGTSVSGKTLGCLGLGTIGSQVATIGKAFQMDVIAWSQNLTAERCAQVGARLVSKHDLFSQADIVTIHLVLSDRTRGLAGKHELGLMKPSAYLVNTSRGPIVDQDALIAILKGRKIAGAGLDVFDQEPLPVDHPIRSLPNTVLTPHLGYVTTDSYQSFYGDMVDDIVAFLKGKPVRVIGG